MVKGCFLHLNFDQGTHRRRLFWLVCSPPRGNIVYAPISFKQIGSPRNDFLKRLGVNRTFAVFFEVAPYTFFVSVYSTITKS